MDYEEAKVRCFRCGWHRSPKNGGLSVGGIALVFQQLGYELNQLEHDSPTVGSYKEFLKGTVCKHRRMLFVTPTHFIPVFDSVMFNQVVSDRTIIKEAYYLEAE